MPIQMPFKRIREIAAERGHSDLRVYETADRFWRADCSCGWMTTRRALKSDALGAAVHHFELVASGAWWRPKFPGGPTYDEALHRDEQRRNAVLRRRDEEDARRVAESNVVPGI